MVVMTKHMTHDKNLIVQWNCGTSALPNESALDAYLREKGVTLDQRNCKTFQRSSRVDIEFRVLKQIFHP